MFNIFYRGVNLAGVLYTGESISPVSNTPGSEMAPTVSQNLLTTLWKLNQNRKYFSHLFRGPEGLDSREKNLEGKNLVALSL